MLNLRKITKDYSTILVDIDNTLFNYTYAHNIALATVLTQFNLTEEDYRIARITIKKRHLKVNQHKKELYFKIICENKNLPISHIMRMNYVYDTAFKNNMHSDTSMMNLLSNARNNNQTVVAITNFYLIAQLEKLEYIDYIDYIDHIVTSEEFEEEKPHRKLLDRALELAGNPDVSKVVMFGDSIVDDMGIYGIKYYPYNCSKLIMSITGKSGSGKSTISSLIKDIWNASIIEGDGYHKYERSNPKWDNLTHYNPVANNLIQLGLDIKNIYQDLSTVNVPIYNHTSGNFDSPVEMSHSNLDVVIIDGLHSLYKEVTGDFVKIKIYIDNIDADNQKIQRDTSVRSKSVEQVVESIKNRDEDYNKYITVQKEYANFIIEISDEYFKITITDDFNLVMFGEYDKNIYSIEGERKNLNSTISFLMKAIYNGRYD